MGLVGAACLDGSAGRNMTENCRGGGNGCIFLINNFLNEINSVLLFIVSGKDFDRVTCCRRVHPKRL